MACSLPLSSSCAKRAPKATEVENFYIIKGRPAIGGTRTGGLAKYTLTCSNAF